MDIKEIINSLQPILIMFIASKVDHGIAVFILPLLPLLVSLAQTYYTKYVFARTASVVVKNKTNHNGTNGSNNDTFDAVTLKLAKISQVSRWLFCKSIPVFIHDTKERSKYQNSYQPFPLSMPQGEFPFKYKGILCLATYHINSEPKVETNSVTLSCRFPGTSKILREFVEDAVKEKWEMENIRTDRDAFIQRVYTFNCSKGSWGMHALSVQKTFRNVLLPPALQHDIEHDIDAFMQKELFYKEQGLAFKRGYLFHGPPGTGKTSCVYALAHKLDCSVYALSLKDVTNLKASLGLIKEPCIILIEEIDLQIKTSALAAKLCSAKAILSVGASGPNDNVKKRALKQTSMGINDEDLISDLMTVLDGYSCSLDKCVIVMTTNHIDNIPKALIRPGRIDRHFYFGPCDNKEATRVARIFTGITDLPHPQDNEVSLSTAELINRVLVPNIDNGERLRTAMLGLTCEMDNDS